MKRTNRNNYPVSVSLDDDCLARLDAEQRRHSTDLAEATRSALVRRLIKDALPPAK